MDTKDPVWDDDETSTPEEGFRHQEPASMQPADASPEPLMEQVESTTPEPAPEPTPDPTPEPTPESASVDIPPPPGGRMRVEPVSGLSNPAPGGGRRERLARESKERSSTSLVIIALLLFVISVISISVYFFSRPAADDGLSQTAPAEQAAEQATDEQPQGATEERSPEPLASETADAASAATQPAPDTVPPAPAPASARPQRVDGSMAKKSISQQADNRRSVEETTPRSQSTPRPSARKPEAAPPSAPSLKTTKSADAAGAQWVVQVHSSQSIDDADEWLQKLQTRNIADGRIEPVTQRGSVWYRVRFGRYPTRQEAEQAALELGYRNAWVDRIR